MILDLSFVFQLIIHTLYDNPHRRAFGSNLVLFVDVGRPVTHDGSRILVLEGRKTLDSVSFIPKNALALGNTPSARRGRVPHTQCSNTRLYCRIASHSIVLLLGMSKYLCPCIYL